MREVILGKKEFRVPVAFKVRAKALSLVVNFVLVAVYDLCIRMTGDVTSYKEKCIFA